MNLLNSMWNITIGIKNCRQLFSRVMAFTDQQKTSTPATEMIFPEAVTFFLLPHKGSFVFMKKNNFEIFMSRHSKWCETSRKVVWNICPNGYVCVRVLRLQNFKSLYLRNWSADRIEIWHGGRAKVSLYSV